MVAERGARGRVTLRDRALLFCVVLHDQFRYLHSFLPLRLSWGIAWKTAQSMARQPIWDYKTHMGNRRKWVEVQRYIQKAEATR